MPVNFRKVTRLDRRYAGEAIISKPLKWRYEDLGLSYPIVEVIRGEKGIFYQAVEPPLTEREAELEMKARKELYYTMVVEPGENLETKVVATLSTKLNSPDFRNIGYFTVRDVLRYDVLTPLMDDPDIEDISFTPADSSVRVFHREFGTWIPTNIVLSSYDADYLVQRIALKTGKSIDIANPVLDAMTPEGYRVALTFSREVTLPGSTISIRKPYENVLTLSALTARNTMTPVMASLLWYVMENRGVILVVGRSGTGKTTIINAALTVVPPSWKIVTVEEIPELRVLQPHWVRLISRKASSSLEFAEKVEINLDRLIAHTLRIRPDLVSVGEVRKKEEMREFIHSVASGHGGITSLHAEDFDSLKARFNYSGIDDSFFSIVSLVVFVNSYVDNGKLRRRVQEMGEILLRNGSAYYTPLAVYDRPTDKFKVSLEESVRIINMAKNNGLSTEEFRKDIEYRASFLAKTSEADPNTFMRQIKEFYERRGYI